LKPASSDYFLYYKLPKKVKKGLTNEISHKKSYIKGGEDIGKKGCAPKKTYFSF